MEEEQARAFLDEHGYLSPGSSPLVRGNAYLVFSQEGIAVDPARWQTQATRFFGARVGLALSKSRAQSENPRDEDAYLVLVEPPDAPLAKRLLYLRPRSSDDLALAERIESERGARGMADLAARCRTVCLVESESDMDRAALCLAALAASILLGPIVPPTGDAIYGVRTAREKLESMRGQAYR